MFLTLNQIATAPDSACAAEQFQLPWPTNLVRHMFPDRCAFSIETETRMQIRCQQPARIVFQECALLYMDEAWRHCMASAKSLIDIISAPRRRLLFKSSHPQLLLILQHNRQRRWVLDVSILRIGPAMTSPRVGALNTVNNANRDFNAPNSEQN